MNKRSLIIICGPTAVGKTAVSIAVAKKLNAEIISFDSRQFFIETSIGTAKPDTGQLGQVQHHFINSHHVWDDFSSGEFADACSVLLNEPQNKNKNFILVGGSGLYIDALVNGMDELPGKSAPIRNRLDLLFEKQGIKGLQDLLKKNDESYFNTVDINNKQRLMRALEVIELSGQPFSELLGKRKHEFNFNPVFIGLDLPRQQLYDRINNRVDSMINNGLVTECEQLLEYKSSNALRTVGYKEIFEFLDGKLTLIDSISLIKQHTRNYAKRQLTWFRRNKNITWFHPDDEKGILDFIDKALTDLQKR